MNLSEFIYKRRILKRVTETLSEKNRKKVIGYINDLEDEIIRLSRPSKAVKENEGTIERTPLQKTIPIPHFTDNWQFTKKDCELNVMKHLKHLDIEVGERPDMRKIYCIGDIKWMELNFPLLYKIQMQKAYNRMAVKQSWDKNKNRKLNGIEFEFDNK